MSTIITYFEQARINNVAPKAEIIGLVELLKAEDREYHYDDTATDIGCFEEDEAIALDTNILRLKEAVGENAFWDLV